MHTTSELGAIIAADSFSDWDLRDPQSISHNFTDYARLNETWIMFSNYVNQFYGTSSSEDFHEPKCKRFHHNTTYKRVTLSSGQVSWVEQKYCDYNINLFVSDTFMALVYNITIRLYNTVPY